MWCTADNHKYMGRICAKGFLDLHFEAIIDNISHFHKIAPNFTYSKKHRFFLFLFFFFLFCFILFCFVFFLKYNQNFLDQLLLPYRFYGRDM